MRIQTKQMLTISMLGALAYLAMFFIRVPVLSAAPFLKYEPKDVVIAIGGFLYGPLPALAVTVVVAFVEMVTVSETGIIGFMMNVLASAAFVCTAAVIYKRIRNLTGAVIGLAAGCVMMTAVMLLWNYIIVPLYMDTTREVIAGMLLTVFLPFNLIKSVLNAAVVMVLYKPVSTALRMSGLHKEDAQHPDATGRPKIGVLLVSLFVIVSIVLLILIFQGKL